VQPARIDFAHRLATQKRADSNNCDQLLAHMRLLPSPNNSTFSASDGTLAWSFGSINGLGPPIVADGKVFLRETDFPAGASIYAFDAATGANIWTLNLGDGGAGAFASANGVIYTDSSDRTDSLLALDLATGRKLWGLPNSPGLLVVANGVIYGFPKFGQLVALDPRNGKLLKTVSTNRKHYRTRGGRWQCLRDRLYRHRVAD
jgi:outer membrane protein assembly factor BamB